jgi:hypothetical protein
VAGDFAPESRKVPGGLHKPQFLQSRTAPKTPISFATVSKGSHEISSHPARARSERLQTPRQGSLSRENLLSSDSLVQNASREEYATFAKSWGTWTDSRTAFFELSERKRLSQGEIGVNSGPEDEVVPVAYATERDRRIYQPGYFHAPEHSRLDQEQAMNERNRFYRLEQQRESCP